MPRGRKKKEVPSVIDISQDELKTALTSLAYYIKKKDKPGTKNQKLSTMKDLFKKLKGGLRKEE